MNAVAAAPKLSTMLAQVAVLVTVETTSLGLKRQDKDASKRSDMNHNAELGASTTSVNRFQGKGAERVKEIKDVANELIAEVRMRSTDWNGQRMVPNTTLQEVLGIWHAKKADYDAKVSALVADAPMLIAEAESKIGTYKVVPPSEDEIREAFSMTLDVSQIPDSDSFKASNLDANLEAEMRRRFEAGIEAAYTNATNDALQRVAKPLAHLVERMTEYSKAEDEKERGVTSKGGRLYESTISHVQDIGKVFASFNLTGDPLMASVAGKLDAFANIGIDDLKGSKAMRDHVSAKAEEILKDLADLL